MILQERTNMLRRTTLITIILVAAAFSIQAAQNADPGRVALENVRKIEVIDGDLDAASKQYNQILSTYGFQRPVVAEALFRLAEIYRKQGDVRARETYRRIVLDYPDQKDIQVQAQTRIGEKVWPGQVYQLTWIDRTGNVIETIGPVGFYRGVELSPDETRVAGVRLPRNAAHGDIWIGSPRSGLDARFTVDGESWMPIWSPDGRRIVFSALRKGKWGLYVKPASGGAEELLLESEIYKAPLSWSADGRFIVYWLDEQSSDRRRGTSWVLPLAGNRQPFPFIANTETSNHANGGQISPDGRWIAYQSRESGRWEVYIKPFPTGSGKWRVSVDGGHHPRWRGDGSELYFMNWPDEPKLMLAAEIRAAASSIQVGTPHSLFATEYIDYHGTVGNWHAYAVSRDGQRFLIPRINISGTWKATAGSPSWTLAVRQDGRKLTGAIQGCGASLVQIFDGTADGEKVSFKCRSAKGAVIVYTGVNRGNAGIDFTWEPQGGAALVDDVRSFPPRKFTADRISDGTEPEIEAMARSAR
jgi:hypothetical protein